MKSSVVFHSKLVKEMKTDYCVLTDNSENIRRGQLLGIRG